MASQAEIISIVGVIGSAYPNFAATKETVSVYYDLLKDLPADLLKAATLQCCAESGRKFAPSVGEIRGAAGSIQTKALGIPSTLDAWNEVCSAPKPYPSHYVIIRNGEQVPPPVYQWSHPLVERIAKQFGWPEFPNYENESVDRAHFFKQYEAALQNSTNETMELPDVTHYIEANSQIKQLAGGMAK